MARWFRVAAKVVAGLLIWPLGAWFVWRGTRQKWLRGLALGAGGLWMLTVLAAIVAPPPQPKEVVASESTRTPTSSPTPSPKRTIALAETVMPLPAQTSVATPSVTPTPTQTPSPTPTAPPTPVPFFGGKYSTTVRDRIEELAAAKDCAGLQREFDTAERNNLATFRRTGDGTADLMGYIDDKMRTAGCYSR